MKVTFHPDAREELRTAIVYYDQEKHSLGAEFLLRVAACIDHIRQFPLSCPHVTREYRRAIVRKFPYTIVYRIGENTLEVVAFMHSRRRPEHFRERLL